MRILAVSAEHNVDHAALADTVNIAEARGGKIYPGNSALGEVLAVGSAVTRFKAGDIAITHCNGEPDEYGASIPGQTDGSAVEYYLSASDILGREGTSPRMAPDALHYFEIGTEFEHDMEADRVASQGWGEIP